MTSTKKHKVNLLYGCIFKKKISSNQENDKDAQYHHMYLTLNWNLSQWKKTSKRNKINKDLKERLFQ